MLKTRNGSPGSNQELFIAGHAIFTLQVNPPTSPVPHIYTEPISQEH